MAFTISDPFSGLLPVANIDTGFIPPVGVSNGSTTTYPNLPLYPGMIVEGFDPTYGYGEFILLKGVASTAVGSVVSYNTLNYTTTLAAVGTNVPYPIAVSMSANTSSSNWSWYQISGVAVAQKSAVSLVAGAAVGIATAGFLSVSATSSEVESAVVATTATAATTTVQVNIARPNMQGRIT